MLSTSISQQELQTNNLQPNLDAAQFWKQAYERAERQKLQLQDYIHRFESRRLDASNEELTSPRKRKADNDQPVKANTQSKRREMESDTSVVDVVQVNANDKSDDATKDILRQIFQLKCLLRGTNAPLDQLCLRTGSICQAVETVFTSMASLRKGPSTKNDTIKIADLATLFTVSYPLILQAIDHATTREAADNDLTIANGSIVQFFQAALGYLHKLSLDEVTRLEEESSRAKTAKSNTKAIKSDSQGIKNSFEVTSKALVAMLAAMLTSIDPKKDSHCELLEGLFCALLDHIASSLSLQVFADPEAPEGAIGLEPPCGLTHVSHVNTKAALIAAQIEGPYLIAVLRTGLRFIRNNQQRMSKFMQEIFSWTECKDIADATALHEKIEARLQGTLLRGVFGEEDKVFENALRREHPLMEADIEAIKGVKSPEQDKSTWFIGQIWEQLGWEMLSGRPKSIQKDPA